MTPETTKTCGILGDSLTLLGSVVLAWEALRRRKTAGDRRATLATAVRLEEGKLVVVNKDGKPVSELTIEDEEISFARGLAFAGVLILVVGFSILLMVRIFGVES